MDKNKSIDGLKPRRSSKAASSASVKISTKSKKTKSTPTAKISKSTTDPKHQSHPVKSKHPAPVVTAASKPKQHPTPPTTAPSRNNITEDFLSPAQVFDFDDISGELKATKDPAPTNPKQ